MLKIDLMNLKKIQHNEIVIYVVSVNGHDTTQISCLRGFVGRLRVVLLQLISIHNGAVGVTDLGVMLPYFYIVVL